MNIGTYSIINKHLGATQSGLDKYIAARMESNSEFKPIDKTKLINGTHSYASSHAAKTGTQSFKETLNPEHFGVVKSFGTHSIFHSERINKGVTHSHPKLNFTKQTLEFKTQSSVDTYGLKMLDGKITYNNPNLIKGTHSYTWASNTNKTLDKRVISNTHSNAMQANHIHGTMSFASHGLSRAKNINMERKFYAKPNLSTQKIQNQSFSQFIGKLSNKPEIMIKTKNVTVNGIIITNENYELKSGDVVRVGSGHYINNSKQIAIVE